MGGGASKSDSCADNELDCVFSAGSGLSYNQVLATNKRAPDAMARREANFGTASQVLAASDNSLSRAAMAAMTRVANHGLSTTAEEAAPLKISRVASRSCAASRQFSQEAMWLRSAGEKASLNSSTLLAEGRTAAESSNKSCSLLHSSLFFFNRFHIPASLLLLPWFSISALLSLAYHSPPGPKEPHLHRVAIQFQNFRYLLDRKLFHFLQDQHQPVPLIQPFQQPLHVLPCFDLLADIRPRVHFFP